MAELDTEHVRMLNAGRQRIAYTSPISTRCFSSVNSKKTQLLQHGNTYGLTFVASNKGFVMTRNDELEASCTDYIKRRQEAMDHGQKLTLEEIYELPVNKEVQLPSIAYWIALSVDESTLAVAYGDSVALYEVAHVVDAPTPTPYRTLLKLQVQEMAWCSDPTSEQLAILTLEKQAIICTLEGLRKAINTESDASSVGWSPSGKQIAIGLVDGTIAIYDRDSLKLSRSIMAPKCCADINLEVHHINWAEDELFLAGYHRYDSNLEKTTALACIFDHDECVELDEVVGFFDVHGRRHQYFTLFLSEWRMFFIGCSLSADIELLVSDPESGEWQLWKPLERYQARLPDNSVDEESFPMGLAINLNSTVSISVDEDLFPPVPIISCTNTDGLLLHFAFVDTTVHEVDFVKAPLPFDKKSMRTVASTSNAIVEAKMEDSVSPMKSIANGYGQNDENEFAESVGESSDEEEERKEEEDNGRSAFRTIAINGVDFIASEQFPKLFKALGSTYDEEEHANTIKSLSKDGKIYEGDFVSWYVNWIFGDEGSESDREENSSLMAIKKAEQASEVVTPARTANATSIGSIGLSGLSTPVFEENNSKPSFSFSVTPVGNCNVSAKDTSNFFLKKAVSHEYGQNDENEFAKSDSESSDEEEERKEEEATARVTFRTLASDGTDFIASELFPKLFKAMGSTYDEEEHASIVKSLSKDGKIYEDDFVSWYVNWIFGDEDLESNEKKESPVLLKPALKSKEEIAAVFSRFAAAKGSWKCAVCLVSNGPDATKCSACETPNPAAPKVVVPVSTASTSAGFIGSSGFSFPGVMDTKSSSFSFGGTPVAGSAVADGVKSSGFSFGGASFGMEFSFPSVTTESRLNTKPVPDTESENALVSNSSAGGSADALSTLKSSAECAASDRGYPPDTISAPKPPVLSTADGNCNPSDTASKPKLPVFGAARENSYPPDTTSKPKPPTFGTATSSGYPPDTTSKPKPPAVGAVTNSGYPPDTTSKPNPPGFGAATNSGYPPDTTSKPKPPAFSAATNGGYPPDTTSKPKPPAFGAATNGGYPPDTTSKPKPPAFGASVSGGNPPDTTSKPKPPAFGAAISGGYPPDTTSKPKPPAFGAAISGGYPPDTTSKSKPPAFGAVTNGGYPPDTTSKPKPSAIGATSSGGYPPDTTSKPKPPAFGAATKGDHFSETTSKPKHSAFNAAGCGGYPPDTTYKSRPPAFGATIGGGLSSSGKSLLEPKPEPSKSVDFTARKLPFGVAQNEFSSGRAFSNESFSAKTSFTTPTFSFETSPSTLSTTEQRNSVDKQPPIKRTLNFGDTNAYETTQTNPFAKTKAKPLTSLTKTSKGLPSSRMEGQLWKLIVDFDKSLQRVNKSTKTIPSKNVEFSDQMVSQSDNLRMQISKLCESLNNLDEIRDRIEKDVLFVIGSDGDVHEQLEYGREILDSFNDESLKKALDEQPLDARSKEVWASLKKKLIEVDKCCAELECHLSSFESGTDRTRAVSSAHLFRVLKQTYDNSKAQYNKACELAEHLEKLSLRGDRIRRTPGFCGIHGSRAEARTLVTKTDMMENILKSEERDREVRRHFLTLCNSVITPRDVFSTPRRKLAPPTPSHTDSPLRSKACSKLMPKTQLNVASPMSTLKQSAKSVLFNNASSKFAPNLVALAEAMTPKDEPVKLVQTPQTSVGVGKAPQRPSLETSTIEDKPKTVSSNASAFSFAKDNNTGIFGASMVKKEAKDTSSTLSFGVNSPAVKHKRKADENLTGAFSLGGQDTRVSASAFSFGSSAKESPLQSVSTIDYKARLEDFYTVHNPSKLGNVLEKTLTTYKGREEELFTRLFTMYIPTSTPEDVKAFLEGGSVPPKSVSVTKASQSLAPATTEAKSSFGEFGASASTPKEKAATLGPFGSSPSAFSLGPAANKSFGSSAIGCAAPNSSTTSLTTSTASPFGKPAVDYRQKLIEFYQKHNPDKISSVDATLQKYKGNEVKLFQNLALKYKVSDMSGCVTVPPASPAVQGVTSSAGASPFGKSGAFSFSTPSASAGASSTSTSSLGFGAAKPAPSASPFGAAQAPVSSPFSGISQSSTGFGLATGSGFSCFQSTTAPTPAFSSPSPFGAASSSFGAAGGVNYRDKLTAFYQQHNPAKLSSVDATLAKYKGREDQLFGMLEQKYVKKAPVGSTSGGFGIPSTTAFGGGSSFGTPSTLGAANPAFGSVSTLGGTAQPTFGGSAGSGFGLAARMGGGFGSAAQSPSVASSGTVAGSGFGAFGSQPPSFSGSAQQSSGFGANSGGFGFGSGAPSGGFGQPAAFSSSSFSQMR